MKATYLFIVLLLLLPLQVEGKVIINEVGWMGTEESYADEWIELYNCSEKEVNLENWVLKSNEESPKIKLKGKVAPNAFFILKRTDDTTLPDVKADLIYTGGLNNKGETLTLINSEGEVIEKIDCSDSWFEGNNKNKRTMERNGCSEESNKPSSWHTSQVKGGTPAKKNSVPKEPEKIGREYYEGTFDSKKAERNSSIASLIALVMSLSSAALILALKRSIKKDTS